MESEVLAGSSWLMRHWASAAVRGEVACLVSGLRPPLGRMQCTVRGASLPKLACGSCFERTRVSRERSPASVVFRLQQRTVPRWTSTTSLSVSGSGSPWKRK